VGFKVSVVIEPRGILPADMGLPDLFSRWFESRGWTPRKHQLADRARPPWQECAADRAHRRWQDFGRISAFADRASPCAAWRARTWPIAKGKGELHTLYISPLKALATDIRRNLETPIAEMQLPVRAESVAPRHAAKNPPPCASASGRPIS